MNIDGRLLTPSSLPDSLWVPARGVLILPKSLADAYSKVIDRHELRGTATTRDMDDPPVGGLDQKRTDKHFAQAFDGSSARAQLALLDPKNEIPRASNAFVSCLAGNAASVTDAPCGAGAAALSFLATVAELRAKKILPRMPLQIHLIGAELSTFARAYAQEVLDEIRPVLEEQAIFVKADWLEWDVTDSLSNTDLIRMMTQVAVGKANRLLVVANFNGFLEKDRKRKEAESKLGELFRHASGNNSMAIWIEPNMNRATEGVFPWLKALLKASWRCLQKKVRAEMRKYQ